MDSAPYLNTLSTRLGSTLGSRQNRVLRHPSRQPIKIEHGKNPSTSSANQNLVLRHPSRQPIRIEHYVTRVVYYVTRDLPARVEDPSRLSARVGSL